MLYSGTDSESYIIEYTLVYEDIARLSLSRTGVEGPSSRRTYFQKVLLRCTPQMCSGSEAGTYVRLIDYRSTLGVRVIKKKKKTHPKAQSPKPKRQVLVAYLLCSRGPL